MNQAKKMFLVLLFVSGLLAPSAMAIDSYTVSSVQELTVITESYDTAVDAVSFIVNGHLVYVYMDPLGGSFDYVYIDGVFVRTLPWGGGVANDAWMFAYLMSLTSPGSVQNQNSASTVVSQLVFEELVVPMAKTRNEQKSPAGNLRSIGGSIRYENVEDHKNDGDLYGLNLGLAYDMDQWTFGGMLPYDRFDFDNYDGERWGAILFGQYHWNLSDALTATTTTNVNYFDTNLEYAHGGGDFDIRTLGIGVSLGVNYQREAYELGAGTSLQYNKDDIDWDDDEQYLLKVGANAGYRILDNQVLNTFCTYTNDVTNYQYDYGDEDLFDVGAEYKGDFSDNWSLSLGYKKTLGLDDYDNDTFYLGSIWKF